MRRKINVVTPPRHNIPELTSGRLVDYNVCTSGMQLNALARNLRAAGVGTVVGLALARASR